MPGGSGGELLSRTIDINYAAQKRSAALKWTFVNAALLLVFAGDLWCKCPGYTSALHLVELALAAALGGNLLLHAVRLLPARHAPLCITRDQRRLLGLSDSQLDSSFRIVETSGVDVSSAGDLSRASAEDASLLSLSRSWGSAGEASGGAAGGGSPRGLRPPSAGARESPLHDRFIADTSSLGDYLRQYEERSRTETAGAGGGGVGVAGGRGARYQLASADAEGGGAEEGAGGGVHAQYVCRRLHVDPLLLTQYCLNLRLWLHVTILQRLVREVELVDEALARHHLPDVRVGEVGTVAPGRHSAVCVLVVQWLHVTILQRLVREVELVDEALARHHLPDVRVGEVGTVAPGRHSAVCVLVVQWLHVTILQRLVREVELVDEALARHHLPDVRVGEVSVERLRKVATSPLGAAHLPSLRALLPYLEPFVEQRYLVSRIRELASGGCLSQYKWNRGGSDWDDAKPTDAEIIMHLFATYVDGQQPALDGAGEGLFSTRHVSAAPARPARSPRALALHRASLRPPHYLLVLGEETVEVSRGRNNLLHTLLVFLAAAARGGGGGGGGDALRGLQLGRAGLNVLWVIGR